MIMRTVLFCWPALFRNFFCFGMFLTNHVGLFAWNVVFMEWWRAWPSEAKMLVMAHYCRRCAGQTRGSHASSSALPLGPTIQMRLVIGSYRVDGRVFQRRRQDIYLELLYPSPLSLVCLSSQRLKTSKTPTPSP